MIAAIIIRYNNKRFLAGAAVAKTAAAAFLVVFHYNNVVRVATFIYIRRQPYIDKRVPVTVYVCGIEDKQICLRGIPHEIEFHKC